LKRTKEHLFTVGHYDNTPPSPTIFMGFLTGRGLLESGSRVRR